MLFSAVGDRLLELLKDKDWARAALRASDYVLAIDKEARLLQTSPGIALPLKGSTPSLWDWVSPACRQSFQAELSEVLTNGLPRPVELQVQSVENGTTSLAGWLIPTQTKDEHPLVLLLATDRTRSEQDARQNDHLSAQLKQAQKMEAVGQLTGGVAHDFNNLLTAILGTLELAEMGANNPAEVVKYVGIARDAAVRASGLTQRLLAFSRKQSLRPRPTDLIRLVEGITPLLRTTLGETIQIDTPKAEALWACEVDTGQLENVIVNLAVNARDAMPHGGSLRISAANVEVEGNPGATAGKGQYVRLTVEDTGTGMPEDVLTQAFEPFFTTKDVGRGSGLGLSMVYGFVKQSGGHVVLTSEVGVGTTVQIDLPRTLRAVQEQSPVHTPTPETNVGPLVLVVEDDALVREVSEGMLARLGYTTISCGDAGSAISILKDRDDIEILFTDIVLPGGVSGIELAYEARQIHPKLRVLHTTGYAEEALVWDRLDATIEVLEKPFSKGDLAQKLDLVRRSPMA